MWPFKRKNKLVKKIEKILKLIPKDGNFDNLIIDLNNYKSELIKDLNYIKLLGKEKGVEKVEHVWFSHCASALNNYLHDGLDDQKWKVRLDKIWIEE